MKKVLKVLGIILAVLAVATLCIYFTMLRYAIIWAFVKNKSPGGGARHHPEEKSILFTVCRPLGFGGTEWLSAFPFSTGSPCNIRMGLLSFSFSPAQAILPR